MVQSLPIGNNAQAEILRMGRSERMGQAEERTGCLKALRDGRLGFVRRTKRYIDIGE